MELAIKSKPLQHVCVHIISIEVWVMKKDFYQFLHIFVKTGAGRRHIVTIYPAFQVYYIVYDIVYDIEYDILNISSSHAISYTEIHLRRRRSKTYDIVYDIVYQTYDIENNPGYCR